MAGLIPSAPVAPADDANVAQPGTPGTEAIPTDSGAPAPPPGADADEGDGSDAGGQGGLIPGEEAPDPTQDQPAGGVGALINNGDDPGAPGMKGTVEDARNQAVEDDPYAEVDATPEEQAEYDQIVSRFLQFICDKNPPPHGGKPPADVVLKNLNRPGVPLATALGVAAAHIVFTLVQGAKAQKVTYSTDVLMHASFEFVAALYLVASAAGIMKGMPPFKGMPEDGDYDFEDAEIKVITEGQMQAVKEYGTMLVKTGELSSDDRKENQEFWKKQIDREVKSGNVSDDVIAKLQAQGMFDKVHSQMGMDGGQQADGSSAPAPASGAPSPDSADASQAPDAGIPGPPTGGAAPAAPPVPPDASSGGGAAPPAPGLIPQGGQ